MGKFLKVAAVVLFFWTLLAYRPLWAAEKMGYVDLSKLFDEYGKTKDYDKLLEDKDKLYRSERDAKVKELKSLQDKYSLLSDKEKEKNKDKIEKMTQDLQQYDQLKQSELLKERDEKVKEILKDIEKIVRDYAEKENYSFVFNDRVLVYQNKSFDITDKVLDVLRKSYPLKR